MVVATWVGLDCGYGRSAANGPADAPAASIPVLARYRVSARTVDAIIVDAEFAAGTGAHLSLPAEVTPFASEWSGSPPPSPDGHGVSVDCANGCKVHYRLALANAAAAIADADEAWLAGGVVVAPPSTWLVRPETSPKGQFELSLVTEGALAFACGFVGVGDHYVSPFLEDDEDPFAAFGPLRTFSVGPAEASLRVAVAPDLRIDDAAVRRWIGAESGLVRDALGRSPSRSTLIVVTQQVSGPTRGKTFGDGGIGLFLRLGAEVTADRMWRDDWVLAHELIHASLPRMEPSAGWLAEGLATYLEPMLRARAGMVDGHEVLEELFREAESAANAENAELEGTGEPLQLYWGGAHYWLAVDLAIREASGDRQTLEDALRAVAGQLGDVSHRVSSNEVLRVADAALGRPVLSEARQRFAHDRARPSLAGLAHALGLRFESGRLTEEPDSKGRARREAMFGRGGEKSGAR